MVPISTQFHIVFLDLTNYWLVFLIYSMVPFQFHKDLVLYSIFYSFLGSFQFYIYLVAQTCFFFVIYLMVPIFHPIPHRFGGLEPFFSDR